MSQAKTLPNSSVYSGEEGLVVGSQSIPGVQLEKCREECTGYMRSELSIGERRAKKTEERGSRAWLVT